MTAWASSRRNFRTKEFGHERADVNAAGLDAGAFERIIFLKCTTWLRCLEGSFHAPSHRFRSHRCRCGIDRRRNGQRPASASDQSHRRFRIALQRAGGRPCTPYFCSVFNHGPCIPEIDYPYGENLQLTIQTVPSQDDAAKYQKPDHDLDSIGDLFAELRSCWTPPPAESARWRACR
jgi:hypothetical protein